MLDGFLLGLANNLGCLAVCSPVLLPYILSEHRSSLSAILRFMAGRLIAYLFFAGFFGSAGLYFEGRINPKLFAFFTLLLSLWLIGFALGKFNLNLSICRLANKYIAGRDFPLLAGLVMGLNICPPFLIGLSKVLELGSLIGSIVFFMGFYIGSSLWVALLILLGPAAKLKAVKISAQSISLLVGLWYLFNAVQILIE